MDPAPALVRNPGVHARAQPHPTDDVLNDTGAPAAAALMVDVVVLTGDLGLFEATRHAVGERNPVWRARSAEESVDLLLTGRCGVLLIDMAAVTAKPATLIEQIVDQFPDVVVVVAGRREDESVLAGLIMAGIGMVAGSLLPTAGNRAHREHRASHLRHRHAGPQPHG